MAGCGSDPAAIVLFLLQDGGAGRGLASREKLNESNGLDLQDENGRGVGCCPLEVGI